MKTMAATAQHFTTHDNAWGATTIDPVYDLEIASDDAATPRRPAYHIHRFLSYFSGPIIWAIEISVVLLIIADHSPDFVDAVIVADLVTIVLIMVFRAAFGLFKDSHPAGGLTKAARAFIEERCDR